MNLSNQEAHQVKHKIDTIKKRLQENRLRNEACWEESQANLSKQNLDNTFVFFRFFSGTSS